ncbi:MAG: hypothetical protein KDB35_06750, partial [Acidimicrobiales bacterium]|nr:hypothetical protein [Acidimicrobiales bacterium]
VDPCPPRHGNRKGVVEKAIGFTTQRWWRTARVGSLIEAQASVDRFCVEVADARRRDGTTVAGLADAEPLMALPAAAFPVEVTLHRRVASNALVSVWGNRYSVPPGLVGGDVEVRWRHGTASIDIATTAGAVVCSHMLTPKGANRTTRLPEHTAALENVVLAAFSSDRPCKTKLNRPPSNTALAIAAQLAGSAGADPVIDLDVYRRITDGEALA